MAEDGDAPGTVPTAATSTTVTVTPGLHGTVAVFDGSQEEWIDYVERVDSYFIANEYSQRSQEASHFAERCWSKYLSDALFAWQADRQLV